MKHLKILKIGLMISLTLSLAWTADTNSKAEPVDATNLLKTHLIDNFEQSGQWFGKMYSDYGFIQVQRRRGYATTLRESLGKEFSSFVIGMKVNFRRTYFSFAEIIPPTDIQLYGKVNKITVWAFGKNIAHKLYAVIEDARKKTFKVPFNSGAFKTLKFSGWEKLEAIIPLDQKFILRKDWFKKRVVQKNSKVNNYYFPEGVTFKKFHVEFDAIDTEGIYYLFLDQLEYVTDDHEYQFLKKLHNVPLEEISYPLENW